MSALAEALLAAQRQAVGALSKAYVAGSLEAVELCTSLSLIGCTDTVDQSLLVDALDVLRKYGTAPPTNGKPDPASEPASQRQLDFLAKLANEKGKIAPDGPLTKARASEAISALQNGTYNADEWTAPF